MMPADFTDAMERHWKDAENLLNAARLANADHLYGLSAECSLKRLMMIFGMPVIAGNPQLREDRIHVNELWARYETYRSGHPSGAPYALPPANPFDDWHISQRYAHQSGFTHSSVLGHQAGARRVRDLIGKARLDGLL